MYVRILVPVDGSPTSNRGLDEAIALAKLTGARLRLIHVVDDIGYLITAGQGAGYSGDILGALRDGGEAILAQTKAQVDKAGVPVDTVIYEDLQGTLADRVVAEAIDWKADLIVIGTRGRRGATRLLLGSDAEQILRLAPVPVLLVRTPESSQKT